MYIINKTKIIKTMKIIKYSLSALLTLGIYLYYIHPQIIYYITAHSRSDDLKFVDYSVNFFGIQHYQYEYTAKLNGNTVYKNIKLPHVTMTHLMLAIEFMVNEEWSSERLEDALDFQVTIKIIMNGKTSYHKLSSEKSTHKSLGYKSTEYYETIIERKDPMPEQIDEISIEIDKMPKGTDYYFVIVSGAGL